MPSFIFNNLLASFVLFLYFLTYLGLQSPVAHSELTTQSVPSDEHPISPSSSAVPDRFRLRLAQPQPFVQASLRPS